MTTSISCFFITNHIEGHINIIFIKFRSFIKVILNNKSVILNFRQLISNYRLFQIYLLSLLLTEDISKIDIDVVDNKIIYGISTLKYWKNFYLTLSYKTVYFKKKFNKNLLNTQEPKRSTSLKKINKFMRIFYNLYNEGYIINPIYVFYEYYSYQTNDIAEYIKKYREYNKKIEILSNILHNYGYDIYSCIKIYLF